MFSIKVIRNVLVADAACTSGIKLNWVLLSPEQKEAILGRSLKMVPQASFLQFAASLWGRSRPEPPSDADKAVYYYPADAADARVKLAPHTHVQIFRANDKGWKDATVHEARSNDGEDPSQIYFYFEEEDKRKGYTPDFLVEHQSIVRIMHTKLGMQFNAYQLDTARSRADSSRDGSFENFLRNKDQVILYAENKETHILEAVIIFKPKDVHTNQTLTMFLPSEAGGHDGFRPVEIPAFDNTFRFIRRSDEDNIPGVEYIHRGVFASNSFNTGAVLSESPYFGDCIRLWICDPNARVGKCFVEQRFYMYRPRLSSAASQRTRDGNFRSRTLSMSEMEEMGTDDDLLAGAYSLTVLGVCEMHEAFKIYARETEDEDVETSFSDDMIQKWATRELNEINKLVDRETVIVRGHMHDGDANKDSDTFRRSVMCAVRNLVNFDMLPTQRANKSGYLQDETTRATIWPKCNAYEFTQQHRAWISDFSGVQCSIVDEILNSTGEFTQVLLDLEECLKEDEQFITTARNANGYEVLGLEDGERRDAFKFWTLINSENVKSLDPESKIGVCKQWLQYVLPRVAVGLFKGPHEIIVWFLLMRTKMNNSSWRKIIASRHPTFNVGFFLDKIRVCYINAYHELLDGRTIQETLNVKVAGKMPISNRELVTLTRSLDWAEENNRDFGGSMQNRIRILQEKVSSLQGIQENHKQKILKRMRSIIESKRPPPPSPASLALWEAEDAAAAASGDVNEGEANNNDLDAMARRLAGSTGGSDIGEDLDAMARRLAGSTGGSDIPEEDLDAMAQQLAGSTGGVRMSESLSQLDELLRARKH